MEQTVKQRLTLFLRYKKIGQGKFEKAAGLSNGYMDKLKKEPSPSKIQMIIGAFPELNKEWLLTGEGEMLKDNVSKPDISSDTLSSIKYYPNIDGTMGNVQFLEDSNEEAQGIIIPGYSDCQFAINAYGDSMYPTIQSGQIVLLTPWTEKFITWGHIYLVVTKSGYRAIKRLFSGTDENKIECRSDNNSSNPPFEIDKDDIYKMYLVKGWICRNEI